VKAILFDVTGRRVRTLIDGGLPAGAHRLIWDGRNSTGESVASGVYFLRFDGDGEKRFRKVLILR
jgi:flagellar hook assembly protein FlgD